MKILIRSLALSFIVLLISGCPKPCIQTNYSFAVNAQIIPDADSIKIGDTIFLHSLFPAILTDQSSNQTVNYNNSEGLGSTVGIVKLVKDTYPGIDAVDNFNYTNIIGMVYSDKNIPSPNKFQQLRYDENNGSYELKIGIIPLKTGIYYLGLGDGLSNGRKNNKNCEKAGFSITFDKTNQHFNLFSEWNSSAVLSSYEKVHAYFFKVYE